MPLAVDFEIVEYVNDQSFTLNCEPATVELPTGQREGSYLAYPHLSKVPQEMLELRLLVVRHFNDMMVNALPLVDLRQVRHVMFTSTHTRKRAHAPMASLEALAALAASYTY